MLSRRQFLWSSATLAGGFAIGLSVQPSRRALSRLSKAPLLGSPAWIEIGADNGVTAYSTLTEMGQGVWTCVAQIVGEELDIEPKEIQVVMAPSWRAFAQPIGFFTGGSTSAKRLYQSFRPMAATARAMLVAAAAEQWQVNPRECHTDAGTVHHSASGRQSNYAQLNARAANQPLPGTQSLKPQSAWRWLGKPTIKNDGASLINGTTQYGMDLRLDGMLVAAVAQNPLPGALLISVDRTAALAQPGVVRIIDLPNTIPGNSTPSGGIAVVANHYWQANRGLAAANVRWQLPSVSTDELQQKLHALVTQNQQLNAVSPDISAIYEAPLLMHAQLEPLNATASVSRFTAEVWAPTQAQEAMQADIANALGLWHHAVIVHTPRVGGGFGRRLATDYGVTAAHIAREFDVPVKTIWSREEDSIQGRFRPMSTARLAAMFDANGHIRNWKSLVASMGEQARLGGLDKTPYDIAQQTGRYVPSPSDIRTGSWRSVDASQNVFFRECFIDECAQSAKIDPLEYRRVHLANSARALRVLDTLARVSDYASAQKQQRFLGIAYSEANGSVTAQAAEAIQTTNGKWRIAKVFAVVDCGIALNPNNIRAQLEGGILFGLSAAIAEEVTYRDGQLEQRNYDKYRVLTIDSAPEIHVEILETPDVDIGGIGEVGVPLIAPAATNALFAATGIRVRRLPLASSGLALAYK